MLLTLFYEIDNFCKAFSRFWQRFLLKQGLAKRIKPCGLCLSEIMTILVNFHMSGFRAFKDYYIKYVCQHLKKEFPGLITYNRFVELMSGALIPLIVLDQKIYSREELPLEKKMKKRGLTILLFLLKRKKVFAGSIL